MPRCIIYLCGAILGQRAADLVLCCNRFCVMSCECALAVKRALLFRCQSKLHCNKCRKSWMLNHCKINVKNRHIISTIIANKYPILLFNTKMTLLYTNLCHWINNIIIMSKIKHQINTINNSLLSDVSRNVLRTYKQNTTVTPLILCFKVLNLLDTKSINLSSFPHCFSHWKSWIFLSWLIDWFLNLISFLISFLISARK